VLESIHSQASSTTPCGADPRRRLEGPAGGHLPAVQAEARTRAQIAREAGLEPLADLLFGDPTRDPRAEAAAFVDADKGVADARPH
jgi:uncharacterized protein